MARCTAPRGDSVNRLFVPGRLSSASLAVLAARPPTDRPKASIDHTRQSPPTQPTALISYCSSSMPAGGGWAAELPCLSWLRRWPSADIVLYAWIKHCVVGPGCLNGPSFVFCHRPVASSLLYTRQEASQWGFVSWFIIVKVRTLCSDVYRWVLDELSRWPRLLLMMMTRIMWNTIASLLLLFAAHQGSVSAVVAEPDGKPATSLLLNMLISFCVSCQLCLTNRRHCSYFYLSTFRKERETHIWRNSESLCERFDCPAWQNLINSESWRSWWESFCVFCLFSSFDFAVVVCI